MKDDDFKNIHYASNTNRVHKRTIKNRKIEKENLDKQSKNKKIFIPIIIITIIGLIITIIIIVKKLNKKEKSPIKILVSDLKFEESKTVLNLQVIDNNHIILNRTVNNIDNSLIVCQFHNLSEINTIVNYSIPNFLENPTKGALKIVKSDLEFYGRKYTELSEELNNLTSLSIELLDNLSYPIENLKNELNKALNQFQDLIKNISIPLIAKEKLLKDLRILNEQNMDEKFSLFYQIEDYKNETEKLNNLFNQMFNYFDESVKIINDGIMEFPNSILDLQQEVEDGMSKFEEIALDFEDPDDLDNFNNNLKKIKENFGKIKKKLNEKLNSFGNTIDQIHNRILDERNKKKLEKIKNESNQILEELKLKSNIIRNGIIEEAKEKYKNSVEIPELCASNILFDLLDQSLTNSAKSIIREERLIKDEIDEIHNIINVEEKTSLDLLIIMDTTISMDPYLSQVKNNLVNIINKIVLECPGIDVNIGFIGYKDVDHTAKYADIDFTKNYEELKQNILNYIITRGTDDPEDVEGAMEMALNKTWKNNARFAILVGDNPCHGDKYHSPTLSENYHQGLPNRKNIEESIKELAEKNVSLLCMKITEKTDIMFEIFKNIYKNYTKCKFNIVPLESDNNLSNIVVDSSVDVYVSQRNTN